MIPWPTKNTKFVDWAESLKLLMPQIDILPLRPTEMTWKIWGNQVSQSSVCQTANVPRTDGFSKWQDWAEAFIRAFGING